MKFCTNCGNRIDQNAIFCPYCGKRTSGDDAFASARGFNPYGYYTYPVYDQRESMLLTIATYIFWKIGFVIWFMYRRSKPGLARSALKGALGGASLRLPVLGGILWLIWREDNDKRDYAKISGISSIIGAGIYALLMIASLVIGVFSTLDLGGGSAAGDMAAFIMRFLG